MYINDIHILFYLSIGVIGLIVGQLIDWCNNRLAKYEKYYQKIFYTIFIKCNSPILAYEYNSYFICIGIIL